MPQICVFNLYRNVFECHRSILLLGIEDLFEDLLLILQVYLSLVSLRSEFKEVQYRQGEDELL